MSYEDLSVDENALRSFVVRDGALRRQVDRLEAELAESRQRALGVVEAVAGIGTTGTSSSGFGSVWSATGVVGAVLGGFSVDDFRSVVPTGFRGVVSPVSPLTGPVLGEALEAGEDLARYTYDSVVSGGQWAGSLVERGITEALDVADDVVVDALPAVAAVPEVALWTRFGPFAPAVADAWNSGVSPKLVEAAWWALDQGSKKDATGDPGGAYTVRDTGVRNQGQPEDPIEAGRSAVISALADTANGEVIYDDEFQLIQHDESTFTVVLSGVVDLSSPAFGLDHRTNTPRDTDEVAVKSASSAAVGDNAYAAMVVAALVRLEVPPGADVMIVGHSLGGDTAIDLASDPLFNGKLYNVTHVVAAGYNSEPQLSHVQSGTEVLVLQNNKDVAVIVENFGHLNANPFAEVLDCDAVVREFDGGWGQFGHGQEHYISYLERAQDAEVDEFLRSVSNTGYANEGEAVAVDISLEGE